MEINLMKPTFISVQKFKNLPAKGRAKLLGRVFLYFLGIILLFVAGVFLFFAKDLPSPDKINNRIVSQSTKIFDRTGEHLLYEIHGEEKRTLIPSQDISDNVKYATVALEDQDFYSHHGIKMTSIVRAALADILKRGTAQGGSTITQQFVKNSILTPERTFVRKIKEVILSIEIEQKFSKDEILTMYLNEIPYGSNAYGIESAAQTFFGKHAKELTLDEAALIVALPNAPTYYSPYGSHLDELKWRQEFLLKKMASLGYITETEANDAKNTDVIAKIQPYREAISAPHFVMYVKEQIEAKYGQQLVEQGGLKVYTTLDWDKQQIAEKAVKDGAEKNKKNWNAENSAMVAADPKTGQILAMVGSKDYFDTSIDGQVNVAVRDRQPGSSFKPYVYLTAFEKGYTPETMIWDVDTNFSTDTGKDYNPKNYDGKNRGPLKMKEALAMSLNVPAVETLYLAGVQNSIDTAKKMGITTLNHPERYGLSLVLGGGEVKLVDHVNAFGTFATGGIHHNKISILKVEDGSGKILEEYKPNDGERVIEEKYIAMIDHILSTNDYRAPVFGENSPLAFKDRAVAAKTGTTNEFRDGWTIGYTPSIVVGVWSGNNNNSSMRVGADGVNVSAPIWRSFLDQVLVNSNNESFPKYEKEDTGKKVLDGELDIKEDVKVCEIPGKDKKYCLANDYCASKDVEKKTFADAHSILWYVKKDDPRGEVPANPEEDPQFKSWEKAVQEWYKSNKDKKEKKYISGTAPTESCNKDDFSKNMPEVTLVVSKGTLNLSFSANVDAPYGISKTEYFVDGSGTGSSYSYDALKVGTNVTVKVEITDNNGNTASDSEDVTL
jgi:1A family penicillin-binding protein